MNFDGNKKIKEGSDIAYSIRDGTMSAAKADLSVFAQNDENGNSIPLTYATRTELKNLQDQIDALRLKSGLKIVDVEGNVPIAEIISEAHYLPEYTEHDILLVMTPEYGKVRIMTDSDKINFVIVSILGYIKYASISSPYAKEDVSVGDRYVRNDSGESQPIVGASPVVIDY